MRTMTQDDWTKRGDEMFGDNMLEWKFICPVCGHVQTPGDFFAYKDKGAQPSDAYQQCIGRYQEGAKSAFSETGQGPCTYAGFGLIRLGPVKVVTPGGDEVLCFDFYQPEQEVAAGNHLEAKLPSEVQP